MNAECIPHETVIVHNEMNKSKKYPDTIWCTFTDTDVEEEQLLCGDISPIICLPKKVDADEMDTEVPYIYTERDGEFQRVHDLRMIVDSKSGICTVVAHEIDQNLGFISRSAFIISVKKQ